MLQGEPSSAGFVLSATSRSYQNSVPVSDGFWMFWMFERNQRFLSHNPETYRLKTGNNYDIYIYIIYTYIITYNYIYITHYDLMISP